MSWMLSVLERVFDVALSLLPLLSFFSVSRERRVLQG